MNDKLAPKEIFWPIFITLLALLIYGHSLSNGFIWDDSDHVFHNPRVLQWSGLKDIWLTPHPNQYYPLTFSFFWLEHKLWGLSPWGYHTVNLGLHILNALLLFGLLRKIAPRLAGITAVAFTIHPIQVETVAWISEQKNLLSLFFFLLAFHAFLDFKQINTKKAYLRTCFFFLLALLSKSIAVCFAAIPLLYAWWKKGDFSRRDIFSSLPLLLIGGISAAVTIHFERTYTGAQHVLSLSFFDKVLLAGRIFFFYIKQILIPLKFMFFYPKWDTQSSNIINWIGISAALGLYAVLFNKSRPSIRGAFALLCFYGISIFPALGFFDVYPMKFSYVADHFTYLSAPALLLLLCSAGLLLFSKVKSLLAERSRHFLSFFAKSIALVLVFYLSFLTFRLTLDYKNATVLWRQLLSHNPKAFLAYHNLGVFSSDPDEAIALFRKAVEIEPASYPSYLHLGLRYTKKGQYENALRAYQQAITTTPERMVQADCHHRMGEIYLIQNDPRKAISSFERAISLQKDPFYLKEQRIALEMKRSNIAFESSLYRYLGAAYFLNNNYQEALKAFRQALALDPENPRNYLGLGTSLMKLGDIQNARQALRKAYDLAPRLSAPQKALPDTREHLDRLEENGNFADIT